MLHHSHHTQQKKGWRSAVTTACALGGVALFLSACADQRLTPVPGEHPDWPQPSPPRSSSAFPLPFTTQYSVGGQIYAAPPARPDGSIPFAVRGETQLNPVTPIVKQPDQDPERRSLHPSYP